MLTVTIDLLRGTFRGDPDGTANTGLLERGEWPPAPARLFAALIAGGGTDGSLTDGSELRWLEQQAPPVIHASAEEHHQRLLPRFVVHAGESGPGHMEYPGRKGATNRAGVRVSTPDPVVRFVWPGARPDAAKLAALRARAARVGYLGASDSPVMVDVSGNDAAGHGSDAVWVPDPDGDVLVRVPRAGDLAIWDQHHAEFLTHGPFVGRLQFGALDHRVRYRSPNAAARADRGTVVSWLRLGDPVSGRRARDVAAIFKAAVLSQHQRISGDPPATLHGHGFVREGYDLARYLPLPDVGHRRADGRIRGVALWMPPGATADERRAAASAARSVRRLEGRGLDVSLAPSGETPGERPLLALSRGRWEGPAHCWASVFPAIHERRVPLDIAEAGRWCAHAGLPTPDAVLESRVPFVHGASDLAPSEVHASAHAHRRYSHVALRFAQPVDGPVVVGAGRQRGMGLCIPVADWRAT